ncbi:MAG TPA: type II CAAX endopeptidase family protein [Thermoanaerobaculia bacterium]|nr:type II CAAX endopeptidase family protein [Thermoanaerobaculia bacterium]
MTSHLIVLLLLCGFPLWDVWEARYLRTSPNPSRKSASYVRVILGLWAVTFCVLAVVPLHVLLRAPSGESSFLPPLGPEVTPFLVGGLILGLLAPVVAAVIPALRTRLLRAMDPMDYLLPRTKPELALFAAVSISAGICEEVIYRGFLMRYLQGAPWTLGLGGSLLVSSAVFGLAHAGQKVKGVLGTALAGLFLGGLYVVSGSLVLPILVHAAMDLRALAFAYLRKAHPGDRSTQ